MNEYLLALFIFPLVWPFIAKYIWGKELEWSLVALNVITVIIVISILWLGGSYSAAYDTEIINGYVTGKEKERVSCSHSYSCNCKNVTSCSGSGKNRSCSTSRVCDTCYEHTFDYSWIVKTTIREFTIDRVDRQGLKEPKRWTIVNLNDPVSDTHTYINWIKGAPDSLFSKVSLANNKYVELVPEYPSSIYDYYNLDRVVNFGGVAQDIPAWNANISKQLSKLGIEKEVNYVIVFAANDKSIADAIEYKWLGGKKNDVIIVIGIDKYPHAEWVKVFAWSKNNVFHADLRDAIMEEDLDPVKTNNIIANQIKKGYNRISMQEFEYLKDRIEPPTWLIVLCIMVSLLGSPAVTWVILKTNEKGN